MGFEFSIKGGRARDVVLAVAVALLLDWGCGLAAARFLGVNLSARGTALSLGFAALLALWLLLVSRSRIALLFTLTCWLGLLHLANAFKIAFLGGPILPSDFSSLGALLEISHGWQLVAVLAPLVAVLGLTVGNLSWRPVRLAWGLVPAAVFASTLWMVPQHTTQLLDDALTNVNWNQRENYLERGPFLYLWHEGARYLASSGKVPGKSQVADALATLQATQLPAGAKAKRTKKPRNIYIVVLETFWDAKRLVTDAEVPDPLMAVRELWAQNNSSYALSPVFGGGTSNAEFEALCGVPTFGDGIIFMHDLNDALPCLPAYLRGAGYETVAYHPHHPTFWNRQQVYPKVGFDLFYDMGDLEMEDRDGSYLADSSFLSQVYDRIALQANDGVPRLHYLLSIAGHHPYWLDEEKRPPIMESEGEGNHRGAYVNCVFHTANATRLFVEKISALDPDGMVLIFGDHLPNLGANLAGYQEAGLLDDVDAAQRARLLSGTPLLIVDNKSGAAPTDDIALYELPRLVTQRLGMPGYAAWSMTRPNQAMRVRQLPSQTLVMTGKGAEENAFVCNGQTQSPECQQTLAWAAALETVTRDLFVGKRRTCALDERFCAQNHRSAVRHQKLSLSEVKRLVAEQEEARASAAHGAP